VGSAANRLNLSGKFFCGQSCTSLNRLAEFRHISGHSCISLNLFRQITSYFLSASTNNLTFQGLQWFLLYAWPQSTETLRQKCMELSFECGYKLFNQVQVSGSEAHWNSNYYWTDKPTTYILQIMHTQITSLHSSICTPHTFTENSLPRI